LLAGYHGSRWQCDYEGWTSDVAMRRFGVLHFAAQEEMMRRIQAVSTLMGDIVWKGKSSDVIREEDFCFLSFCNEEWYS